MEDAGMSETRTFKPHPNLLMDVIRRQAGTLSKALLEAVMNSIDAGATKCEISLERAYAKVADDGKGFAGRQEIERFFEVFGTPHNAGDAVYGQFRMGRGQMFAFGVNRWRSNTFRMDVDVQHKGLDYEFHDGLPVEPGCKVEIALYSLMSNGDLHQCGEDVKSFVAYTAIPVILNGKQVNKVLAEQKWSHEDENAFTRFTQSGSLKVYNLGVFVREFHSGHFGVGGTVVSKRQLKVNFARNDIMGDCKVWQQIKKVVQANALREIKRKPSLDDAGRERMARMFHDDTDAYDKTQNVKLITDVQGRHHTVMSALNKFRMVVTAPDHDRVGDIIMQTGRAFVIAESTLDRFGVADLDELVGLLRQGGTPKWLIGQLEFPDYKKLAKEANSQFRIVPQDKWTAQEKVWMALCRHFRIYKGGGYSALREIKIGDAEGVSGWTDGKTYIAVNRSFLQFLSYSTLSGLGKLGRLLLHEYCHDDDNTESDIHGHEFYREFHENADMVGSFVETCVFHLPGHLDTVSRGMNKRTAKLMDRMETIARAAKNVEYAALAGAGAEQRLAEAKEKTAVTA
jgi:hypothetical protein